MKDLNPGGAIPQKPFSGPDWNGGVKRRAMGEI